jgi:hypothetical protein
MTQLVSLPEDAAVPLDSSGAPLSAPLVIAEPLALVIRPEPPPLLLPRRPPQPPARTLMQIAARIRVLQDLFMRTC